MKWDIKKKGLIAGNGVLDTDPDVLLASHPLDHSIWQSLTTKHSAKSEGDKFARRYRPNIAPFGATRDMSAESFHSLAQLLTEGESIALFTIDSTPNINNLKTINHQNVEQMVWTGRVKPVSDDNMAVLHPLVEANIEEMLSLAATTKPGPFSYGAAELGKFIGIRSQGKLVAMAGERLHLNGFTEVSAVCVDPLFRGQGLAESVVLAVVHQILKRKETPFLHVFSSNIPAIRLYQKLGFTLRKRFHLTVLQRCTPEPVL